MEYIVLKGLFEPDSVAHFAGSLFTMVLIGMIIYRVVYDLIHDYKKHCKSVINKLRTSIIDNLQVVMLFSLLFAVFIFVFIFVTSILTYPFIGVIMLTITWIILGSYLSYLESFKELNKKKGDKE
ncbi:hypothetical protein NA86_004858 [Salmonella enterica subsp. enterica serovar Mbandaka]|nr:hypothetical protein [Salmonella enterica subsp. enterica serovar Mbandaka]HDT4877496.1 hypothetical protein [Enterobacter asburiae]